VVAGQKERAHELHALHWSLAAVERGQHRTQLQDASLCSIYHYRKTLRLGRQQAEVSLYLALDRGHGLPPPPTGSFLQRFSYG
jgi:hypothetical protein